MEGVRGRSMYTIKECARYADDYYIVVKRVSEVASLKKSCGSQPITQE